MFNRMTTKGLYVRLQSSYKKYHITETVPICIHDNILDSESINCHYDPTGDTDDQLLLNVAVFHTRL